MAEQQSQPDWNVAARAVHRAVRNCNKLQLAQQIVKMEALLTPVMEALRSGKTISLRQFVEFDVSRMQHLVTAAASILLVLDGKPPAGQVCMGSERLN